ncbi:MAG: hypothetical protein IJQ02_11965 [Oscillospiraceae bacterium]|nr:hypothetical protein [Oscillospiraceae bacterium]
MLNCKLCGTTLEKKHLRRDGSMLCPTCGQIYWKTAVEKAMHEALPEELKSAYLRESRRSVEQIRRAKVA